MSNVNFIGLDSFTDEEIATIRELVYHHFKKIKHREIRNFNLVVHVKKKSKSGKQDKGIRYSILTRIDAPSFLVSSESTDFNLRKACHEAMVKLESEFNHKFRMDTSYKKPYAR